MQWNNDIQKKILQRSTMIVCLIVSNYLCALAIFTNLLWMHCWKKRKNLENKIWKKLFYLLFNGDQSKQAKEQLARAWLTPNNIWGEISDQMSYLNLLTRKWSHHLTQKKNI